MVKVLLTCASFTAAYGGPAYSVRSLAEALASTGHSIAIWAPDGSAIGPARAEVHRKSREGRPCELTGPLNVALSAFGVPDVFHDSGLWWHHNRQIAAVSARMSKPLVVSIRGMLEPAAFRHRAWKKRIAWHLYQRRILNGAAALHVTSELEAKSVHFFRLRPDIITIPNGLNVPAEFPVRRKDSARRVVFLGRLHPIKGLPMLIEAWKRIGATGWTLDIAGPDEGGYRRELEAQARALEVSGSVHFTGAVRGDEKQQLFSQASVFVLPSHSESFGVVAGEALAAGVPVVATKGTPWAVLERERCGWHVCTSVDGLERGLRAALATSPDELVAMGRRGYAFVARNFSWSRIADDMLDLYGCIRAPR